MVSVSLLSHHFHIFLSSLVMNDGAYLLSIGCRLLMAINSKLNAVIDIRAVLVKVWKQIQIGRERNEGAQQRVLVQNNEAFYVIHHIFH